MLSITPQKMKNKTEAVAFEVEAVEAAMTFARGSAPTIK